MPSRRTVALHAALALLTGFPALAVEPTARTGDMPRVPATPADHAAATFRVRPGFEAQLVAAEPLVQSPVALAFDESRRVYVVEMRDYSERRPERLGRVRLLRDSDGDGRLDAADVFLEGLAWPTAVTCWEGGVFVGATPDLIFAKDTDGDGKADVREVIFTGFASDFAPYATNKLNVQALMNSLHWGLDQRIHGSASMSGGTVQLVDSPFTRAWRAKVGLTNFPAPVRLRGCDFSFDPRTLDLRAETGGGQHGMSFDDVGRKFVCSNSDHLQQVLYDDTTLPSNPAHDAPAARASIAADGPAATVYRASPDEPWRVLRTRWRVAGLVPGPVEGGGRPSGYFTGATGATIYRGSAYGPNFAGDAFIADCGSNLVHRKKLRPGPDGIVLVGERDPSEATSEFLASTDNWFRPVQFANAPDGCLWVIDMYRETIEHPWSLPDGLKQHLDLNSGSDRGRLWRLAPTGFDARGTLTRSVGIRPKSTGEWVRDLESADGWVRDTASRKLHELQSRDAVPALSALLRPTTPVATRLHALNILRGLGTLTPATLDRAARDPAPAVRAEAALLAPDAGFASESIWPELAKDAWPTVRFAVARVASKVPAASREDVLATLVAKGPPLASGLALHSAAGHEVALWERLRWMRTADDPAFAEIARMVGRTASAPDLQRLAAPTQSPLHSEFVELAALADGIESSGRSLEKVGLTDRYAPAFAKARDAARTGFDTKTRSAAIALLAHASAADALPALSLVLANGSTEERGAALQSLARFQGREWADALVAGANRAGGLRPRVYGLLLRRPEGQAALVAALGTGTLRVADLTTETVQALRQSSDATARREARRLLGEPPADRHVVVESRLAVLNAVGDASKGAPVFAERCAGCHQFRGVGQTLGPDLASVASNGPEKLLVAILDPNREVAPNFTAWLAETAGGESLAGILARESDGRVTLLQAGGTTTTLERAKLKRWENTGRSLMPEGLEEGLDDQRLADLLSYLTTEKR